MDVVGVQGVLGRAGPPVHGDDGTARSQGAAQAIEQVVQFGGER